MAKQTFTTGQVLTAAQVNSLQSNDFNQTVSVKTAAYVLAAADKGTRIEFNTSGAVTCTVNTGLFDAGDTVIIQNRGAGDVTVTAGTATVDTAGSLVLSQYQSGTLYFISASASIFFAAAVGDLTAVTSGTGISISNAGGPVPTITNSMATTIDAKGDLVVGTGADTFARLAVGTNGHTLVADSAETTGLKWVAPAGGSTFSGVLCWTSSQGIANTTAVVVNFDSEVYDVDGWHSTSSNNNRITVPSGKGGYIWLYFNIVWQQNGTGRRVCQVRKNGTTLVANSEIVPSGTASADVSQFGGVGLSVVAGDWFECVVYQSSGGSLNVNGGVDYTTQFGAYWLGA